MKDNIKQFIGSRLQGLVRSSGQLKLASLLCAGLLSAGLAAAQPANDLFTNAWAISGVTGTTNGSDIGATLESCEPTSINYGNLSPVDNSVWFAWTCPSNGTAEFDTIGSGYDTVIAIYTISTTTNGLCDPSLNQIAGDDADAGAFPDSQVYFTATAGTTYYISVNGNVNTPNYLTDMGTYYLNWSMSGIADISSGTFRFATAINLNGVPNYIVSDRESDGAIDNSLNPSTPGGQVTVTRTGGSSGRVSLNYTVTASTLTNIYTTNYFGTNYVATYTDTNVPADVYYTNSTLTITVFTNFYEYYNANLNPPYLYTNLSGAYSNIVTIVSNSLAGSTAIPVTNVYLVGFGVAPNGPIGDVFPVPTNLPPFSIAGPVYNYTDSSGNQIMTETNIFRLPVVSTNVVISAFPNFTTLAGTLEFDDYQMSASFNVPVSAAGNGPDAGVFNGLPSTLQITLSNPQLDPLESSDLIPPSLNTESNALMSVLSSSFPVLDSVSVINFERSRLRVNQTTGTAVVNLVRSGGLDQSVSVQYEMDETPPNPPNTFPLQPGSDYAIPGTDFTQVTGTVNFGAGQANASFSIPIINDGNVKFNEDINLQLIGGSASPVLSYSAGGNPPWRGAVIGEVNTATLTILFNAESAGSVDRSWNQNGSSASTPPFLSYPGTSGGTSDSENGNGGTVYAIAEQPNGSAIFAGSFISFDSQQYNRIVRVLPDGYQDTSFLAPPNTGANDFIASLALEPNGEVFAAGNFTAFNGISRAHIALLTSSGSVDPSFNPGLGANGMIWSVALQPNGQIVIAGDFTTFNTNNVNGVARLNPNGSVDTSFNPGIGPDGIVYSVAVDSAGRVLIGGDFDSVEGTASGGVARLNVDGSLDTTFNADIGTYNPTSGGTDPVYAIAIQASGQILIGGAFSYLDLDSASGIARLNTDGTVDTSFNSGSGTYNPVSGFADTVYTIAQDTSGNILIGGNFEQYNQTRRVGLARMDLNGNLDTSFMDTAYNQFAGVINHYHNPNAVNPNLYPEGNQRNYVYSIALEAGGNVIVGGGFLRFGGGSTREDSRPRSNVARLVGGGTPGPGNIELAYPSYSADKDGGNLYVTLTRINGNLGIVEAEFYTNTAAAGPGIAIPGVDFNLPAGSDESEWGTAWSTAWMYDDGVSGLNYAVVDIINNTNITGNLSANLGVTGPNGTDIFFLGGENIPLGVALGPQSTAPLTIIDDNVTPGVIGFSAPTYIVVENQTNAIITLTRTNGSDDIVQVQYKAFNGTGTNGIDFKGVTNTLTFQAGQTSQSFTVPIINGTVVKPDKTVKLNLFNVTGGATLGLTNATLTIVNDNYTPGQLSFSSATYSTNENDGTALITVNRQGGSTGTMGVTAVVGGGTSTGVAYTNYIPSTNQLSWDNGDATPRYISVPVIDDGVVTANKTAILRLTNSLVNNVYTSAPLTNNSITNAVLTVINVDSLGTVQFSSPIYSVKKYGGFALIPVVRTGGSAQTVTVNYTTSDGTATAGNNYTMTNGMLTFTNGVVSQYITVPVINDGMADGLLSLNLVLTNAVPAGALGITSNAVLNIIDTALVNETPGSPDVTYNASGFNGPVNALVLQTNNQLLVGGGFTEADGVPRERIARLNSDGSLDTQFSLPNSAYGANGSVQALAIDAEGRILVGGFFTNFNSVTANYIARLNQDGTLDSLFNSGSGADNPVYALAATAVGGLNKVMVGGSFATLAGTPINGVARLNYDGTLDAAFNPGTGANGTVYALVVQPTDGKVVIGGDFTTVNGYTNFNHIARLNTDGSVDTTFNPGSGASGSVRAIAIQPDGNILIGGLFTNVDGVALNYIARLNQNGSVDTTFTPGLGANDAVFSIALQSDNRIVLGGEFTRCNGVTRNRITRLYPNGTVDPTINFGVGANNFVSAVAIQEDTIQGYPASVPDEKIIIGGGFTQYFGQTHAYLARIYGGSISGSGAFQFSSPAYSVDELGTNVSITVIRTGGTSGTNSDGSGDPVIPFATSDGTAQANTDDAAVTNYDAEMTNLDFPLGEVIKTVTIPVFDDGVITPNLTVNLTLSPPLPSEIGNQPTAVLTIVNDDSAINLTSATYTVPKDVINGVAVIGVQRLGSVAGTSTVIFSTTTNGTALPGTDYTPEVGVPVTFNPGVSNTIVTIPINNNGIPEGNRTVGMQISSATGSVLYSPSNAVLTIIDTVNAPGQLSFSATNYAVTEGGGVGYTNAIITVSRTYGSAGQISASYFTADGTAVAGVKYASTNGSLSFGSGETSKTFVVPVINTPTAEGPEYLNLFLTNVVGGASLAAPTNATLTIYNTNVGLAFTSAVNTFSESGGILYNGNPDTVFISVTRFNNTSGTNMVQYTTTNGTALAGTNYVATSGTLTFYPGDSVKTIPVQLIHDTNVTGTLAFSVILSNPGAGAQLTAPSTTVVQELDAEAGLSFLTPAISVLKTTGYALLPVFDSNPGLGPITVNYATGGGTASSGVDYAPTSGLLTFTNGQQFNFILVPILPNGLVQSNQTFNVTLSNPSSPGVLAAPFVEAVTIIETNTPSGSSFYSPVTSGGDSGSVTFDTSNSIAYSGSPVAWFAWTATNSGEMEFDTIGSVDDGLGITNLGTYMEVFTGTNYNSLNQVVANQGIYNPAASLITQENIWGQNVYNIFNSSGVPFTFSLTDEPYIQPYAGPSQVRFNAVAGQTYYISVQSYQALLSEAEIATAGGTETFDGFTFTEPPGITFSTVYSPPTGLVKLNWALHPSGVFRFATEELDQTGLTYSNGIPMLMYHVSETEGDRRLTGTVNANQYDSTLYGTTYLGGQRSSYVFDVPGLLVSVTRVAGSSGRVQVGYTTAPITSGNLLATNGYLVNGDLPASSGETLVTNALGQLTFTTPDYTPVSGILTFDDSEMSKTIFIPISDDDGLPRPNRDFMLVLTNAVLDPSESTDVQQPRLDNTFNQVLVRILDTDISPQGPSFSSTVTPATYITNQITLTVITNPAVTNVAYSFQPTNDVFNFEKAHYRVTRDISDYWNPTQITLYVNRMGTNYSDGPTIHWRVNSYYLDNSGDDNLENGEFPLQPGSDYATPTPPANAGIEGLVPDFDFPGGYSGTITFGSGNKAFNPQPITFTVANNGLQQFNEDFTVSLYYEDSKGGSHPVGMNDQATVTILYDDNHPPAGSVDEFYNPDFSYNMAGPIPTVPPQMNHPGTDGEVLGLAVQPDNKTIVVGDFFSYDETARNSIVRANADGSLDTTFNPGSGPNNFVNCIALNQSYESYIGGAFSSYNGLLCNGIALITTNGTLDSTFNPGLGFNGTVYALAFQTNGELLVGGDFTSYNGTACNYIALLQANGSLDTSFNPSTNLNSAVYAIGVQPGGQVIVGGNFTSAGGVTGQNYIARLNPDGSFDPSFDPGSGANAAVYALGVQPDGNTVVGGEFTIMNGASANRIARLTANGFIDPDFYAGVGVDGPVYNLTVSTNVVYSTTNYLNPNPIAPVQTNFTIYVGGAFTSVNSTHRLGFARLNADGTVDTTFLDQAYNQFAGLPRDHYNDPLGTVLASGLQSDGNVMIGGSFNRVGGGQSDDLDVRPESIDTNDWLVSESQVSQTQKTRAGIRNRGNIARLIGGATPGPGNIGFASSNYSIDRTVTPENKAVSLVRYNGTLGPASVNFAVQPGLAQSGVDYFYAGLDPLYWITWEETNPMGRMHSDGLYGTNGFVEDVYGNFYSGSLAALSSVAVTILDNTNSLNNVTAGLAMTDPIGADQFYLGGEDTPLGLALGQAGASLTLIANQPEAGTFGFASANYIGTGQGAAISVLRTNGNNGIAYINYATTTNGSTAVLNNDYLAASGTLTFQPSDTNHTFVVPILNSNSVSAVEKTVNLTLFGFNPPSGTLSSLGVTNAVLRLINQNFQGFLNLSSNAYSANLSAGSVVITVTRTVGSKGTLTVQCASTNGTALSGTDYIGFTNTLQWNSGDVAPKTIIVPLLNNGAIGAGKQFGVSISNPALNGSGTPSLFAANGVTNATVFINNDNSLGTFQFSSPGYIVNENGGYSLLTVFRNGGTNGTVMVKYATADGTARSNVNYAVTSGTLVFAPGQLAATIQVPITNDLVVDPPPSQFYFTVSLTVTNQGASLGTPSTAVNYIVDAQSFNRPPGSSDTAFNPGTGMNAAVFALALQSSGQIIAGGNFTDVDGVPESYLARLNTDGSLDRSGFLYGLSGASSAVYALVDQTDDQILVGGTFTNMNGTVLNHIARLNGLDGSLDSSFNPGAGADNTVYSLAETFIGGSRYIYAAGAFGYMNGVSSPFIARLTGSGKVDSTFVPGSGPNATVYAVAAYPTNSIFAGKVLIGGAFTNVNNTAVGHIARLNVDGSVDTTFSLNVAAGAGNTVRALAIQSDDRVVVGGDFTNFDGVALNHLARLNSDGSLDTSFASNVGAGANATVSALAIQTDDRIVVAGQFTVANGVTRNGVTRLLPSGAVDPAINFGAGANGAVNAVVVQPADQMLVIGGSFTEYNNQPANYIDRIYGGSVTGSGLFQFTSAAYSIDEDALQAVIGISRVGGTSGTNADGTGAALVNFSTVAGGSTALAGLNYSNVNTEVSFPPGEVLQYVTVPVIDDSNNFNNVMLNLALTNATPPAGLGDQSSAVLTIINDNSGVAFGSASYSVPKDILTGYGTVNVLRLGSASGTSSVDVFTTTNGTAVTNVDYYPTNVLVTFSPGQTNIVVQVPVINNVVAEGNRTVGLAMSNAVNTLLTSPTNTTLTIIDTVTAPGQLSFGATNFTANANSGYATLNVVRTSGSSGSVSVGYATGSGTATPGVNYTPVSGTVTFNDGQTNATFTVQVLPSNQAIGPVSVPLILYNPSGGAALASPTNTTLTIVNTNAVIAFMLATNTFSETAGTVPVVVTRYNYTNGTSTVDYSTVNGTALSNANYSANSGLLTFTPGESSKTIGITLIHDTNYTGTVAFDVNLYNPTNAQLTAPSTTVIQVLDAEAGISFTNSALSVSKNAGTFMVTVVCANTNVEPVIVNSNTVPLSVNYYTADGTGVNGTDYAGTSGTLVFTNGIGTNSFPVTILANGYVTGNKTFSVILTNPTAPGVLVPPSSAVVTIFDNNTGLAFSSPAYMVNKTAGAALVTVLRTDNTNLVTTVNFTATNGTAVNGLNYTATNGTLVFSNGQTSASFYVPVSDTTIPQPDLTVLMQLMSPIDGTLLAPAAATLTIHDNTGSDVIPAGSMLVTNSSLLDQTNDLIGPGDTVSMQFAFRCAGGTNVVNLIAQMVTNNGVSSPIPATTNIYGPLVYLGHSVSRPFTFTAHGTNNQAITVNFKLFDTSTNNSIGTAVFGYTLGTLTNSFTNTAAIVINANTNASPYPSIINIGGLGGSLVKATVTLNKIYHTSPSFIDALVVSPAGADTLIMAHVGGQNTITNVVLTFDDAATNTLTHTGQAVTSTNKPSAILPVRNFP